MKIELILHIVRFLWQINCQLHDLYRYGIITIGNAEYECSLTVPSVSHLVLHVDIYTN